MIMTGFHYCTQHSPNRERYHYFAHNLCKHLTASFGIAAQGTTRRNKRRDDCTVASRSFCYAKRFETLRLKEEIGWIYIGHRFWHQSIIPIVLVFMWAR
jgi:hypothetical protein